MNHLETFLYDCLKKHNFEHLHAPLFTYLELLIKWNRAYNLTALHDPEDMVIKHILDSLSILPWIKGQTILDVGTGAGFPGIPLALAKPDCAITLLDSNGKKTRFLKEVVRVLAIKNVEIIQSRIETYRKTSGFDTVTSRAFSSLKNMVDSTHHLINENGMWLAMKGRYPQEELEALKLPFRVETYQLDGNESQRCCILIEKESS
jgi:16S rRNA (guanine527-N7)-methyltransferase